MRRVRRPPRALRLRGGQQARQTDDCDTHAQQSHTPCDNEPVTPEGSGKETLTDREPPQQRPSPQDLGDDKSAVVCAKVERRSQRERRRVHQHGRCRLAHVEDFRFLLQYFIYFISRVPLEPWLELILQIIRMSPRADSHRAAHSQ